MTAKTERPKCTVTRHGMWGRSFFCGNLAKHDPDENGVPTKCAVHSAAGVAKRKAKAEERHKKWLAEQDRKAEERRLREEAIDLIRAIAKGHDDPRGGCQEWVNEWEANQ